MTIVREKSLQICPAELGGGGVNDLPGVVVVVKLRPPGLFYFFQGLRLHCLDKHSYISCISSNGKHCCYTFGANLHAFIIGRVVCCSICSSFLFIPDLPHRCHRPSVAGE